MSINVRRWGVTYNLISLTLLIALVIIANRWLWLATMALILLLRVTGPREQLRSFSKQMAWLCLFILLAVMPVTIVRDTDHSQFIAHLSNWGMTQLSLDETLRLTIQCLGATMLLINMITVVPIFYLFRAMRRSAIPTLLTELCELIYRYIFLLGETGHNILVAQRSRGGYERNQDKLRHSGLLISQTLIITAHEADQFYNGMLSRGAMDDIQDKHSMAHSPNHSDHANHLPLVVEQLKYSYTRHKETINGISLTFDKPQKVLLLGANGAGKSTLFYLLNGVFQCSSGSIYLGGEEIQHNKRSLQLLRQQVALVFQNSNYQLFAPTVEEEIAFGLTNLGLPTEQVTERVNEIIERFDLEDKRELPPHKLSEGQKKWVAIAAVMATDPAIIMLDEPTSNLDCYYTRRVIKFLDELYEAGKVVIVSTHDMSMAYEWGERAIVINQGEVIADADTRTVFNDPSIIERANLELPVQLQNQTHSLTHSSHQPFDLNRQHCPIFLQSQRIKALIIGGGEGALRKLTLLSSKGVQCDVVAVDACDALIDWCQSHKEVRMTMAEFDESHLEGYNLIIAATGIYSTEVAIIEAAAKHSLLASSISFPELGCFEFAAMSDQQGIQIALHTNYKLPQLTQHLKETLNEWIPNNISEQLKELSQQRQTIIEQKQKGLDVTEAHQAYELLLRQILNHFQINNQQ